MYSWTRNLWAVLLVIFSQSVWSDNHKGYHFGHAITELQIKPWDIDVTPDGNGLPFGEATADDGEDVYLQKCAACHGDFGEGMGRFPVLTGSQDELVGDRTHKTVGGYWPVTSTLFDYINRAMPFGNAQSLTPTEVYGVVAYILSMNDIIDSDTVINAKTLPLVIMPNHKGFITAQGSDLHLQVCMDNCKASVNIKSRATQQGLEPTGE